MSDKQSRGRPVGSGAPKSDAVKKTREKLGLTQMQFAQRLACALSSVQRMERLGVLPTGAAVRERLVSEAEKAGVELPEAMQ